MKQIKNIIITLIIICCSACTAGFEEYVDNPNVPEYWNVSPYNLMEEIIYTGINGMVPRTYSLNSELIQYLVSSGATTATHRYYISNATMSSAWNSVIIWAANADHMRQLARVKEPNPNLEAIATTMEVFYLSNLTDMFGDIPCNEAFKGVPYYDDDNNYVGQTILKPAFDTQQDVYKKLFAYLEKANSLYNSGANQLKYPDKDLLYKGDISKWKKFNNSLYLRLLMRLSNRGDVKMTRSADGLSEMTPFEKMTEIVASPSKYPVFESVNDNATLFYSGEIPFVTYYYDWVANKFNHRAAAQIINMMKENSDPRLESYFIKSGDQYNGAVSGIGSEDLDYTNSGLAGLNYKVIGYEGNTTAPYSIMKYDELMFILSEAAKRGIIPGGDAKAEEYYNKAVTASIYYWFSIDPARKDYLYTVEQTASNFLLTYAPYNYTLENILNQKYIAMFWTGYEAWCDYRRTGLPELLINSATFNDHILPTRFEYPFSISTTNPVNYANAVNRMIEDYGSGDGMKTPVWWSKDAKIINP